MAISRIETLHLVIWQGQLSAATLNRKKHCIACICFGRAKVNSYFKKVSYLVFPLPLQPTLGFLKKLYLPRERHHLLPFFLHRVYFPIPGLPVHCPVLVSFFIHAFQQRRSSAMKYAIFAFSLLGVLQPVKVSFPSPAILELL